MNEAAPQISVVVPTYNTAGYIGDTLDSIFAQDYPNYEVIVVNDGSPDTPQLEAVLERFSGRITYLKKPNGGVSSARNVGIRASTGDFISTLDSDDLFEPNYMRVQAGYIAANPDVDMVYGDGIAFGDGLPDRLVSEANPSHGPVTFEALVDERCCIPTSGVMVRRSALIDVGLMEEGLRRCEDFDLWLRVLKGGYRIAYHREVIFRYRCHTGGLSSHTTSMFSHGAAVMERMLARTDLTASERRAAENARNRLQARMLFHEGKLAFEAEDFTTAAEKIASANATFQRPRLAFIVALIRLCPRLLWRARRFFWEAPQASRTA